MNRRELIKAFAGAVPLTVAGRVWAAPATDARLLVAFLRGAYDAANVVVPIRRGLAARAGGRARTPKADLFYRSAAADFSRQDANTEHRHQQQRQTRRR